MICLNESQGAADGLHTLAHELAHIALGHLEGRLTAEEQAERLACFILGFARVLAEQRGGAAA